MNILKSEIDLLLGVKTNIVMKSKKKSTKYNNLKEVIILLDKIFVRNNLLFLDHSVDLTSYNKCFYDLIYKSLLLSYKNETVDLIFNWCAFNGLKNLEELIDSISELEK